MNNSLERLIAGIIATLRTDVIPNVTDNFTGAAPDLGAYEFGQPVPLYGPRWQPTPGVDE